MIPKGTYTARARDWTLGRTGTGKEQIAVLFEITSGDHQSLRIGWYGYFTEKTVDRTLESLEIMGWNEDPADPQGLDTNEVSIVVDHEENPNDGQTYARVRWVNRLGAGAATVKEELSGAERVSFAQRMKGALLARKQRQEKEGKGASFNFGANGPPV